MIEERIERYTCCLECHYHTEQLRFIRNVAVSLFKCKKMDGKEVPDADTIPMWCPLEHAPPKVGDCKGCIRFDAELYSSWCQRCLRMNGIVDYYLLSKKKVK